MSNLVIQTNVLALNAHRNTKTVGTMQEKASAKLSSGYKINSAADDAAGLAISEKMRSQIRGLDMASKNAQDAISLIQTAEGGMQEIDNMVQRIRELIVYASNDTNENNAEGTGDRQKIQDEIGQLVEEIDSMSERVEFNKKKVINGDYADALVMKKQTQSTKNYWNLTVKLRSADLLAAGLAVNSLTTAVAAAETKYSTALNTYATTLANSKSSNASVRDKALAELAGAKAAYETAYSKYSDKLADQIKAQTTQKLASTSLKMAQNQLSAATKLYNTWSAVATTQVNSVAGLYMQVGANAGQGFIINIGKIKSDILGIGDGDGKTSLDVRANSGINITDQLTVMDLALSYVTTERSKLGAYQNRLEFTIKSVDISSENLSASESRIRDADMGKEMMRLTAANILQNAGVSMLAQANQNPQSVLQLLR